MTIVNSKNQPIRRGKHGEWKRVRNWSWKVKLSMFVAFVLISAALYGWYWMSQRTFDIRFPVRFITPVRWELKSETQSVHGLVEVAEAKEETVVEPLSPKDLMKLDVCNAFGFKQESDECKTALAITEAESHFNPRAMGWNCKYTEYDPHSKKTSTVSKACKPSDRGKAWSVDCGLMQINVYGQVCPEEYYDIPFNLKLGVGKYKGRGNTWGAWSTFNNGSYLQYKAK